MHKANARKKLKNYQGNFTLPQGIRSYHHHFSSLPDKKTSRISQE